jgi:hypothetical protein
MTTRGIEIFNELMDELDSDRFSIGERLRLAAHLATDAFKPGTSPDHQRLLLKRVKAIVKRVEESLPANDN